MHLYEFFEIYCPCVCLLPRDGVRNRTSPIEKSLYSKKEMIETEYVGLSVLDVTKAFFKKALLHVFL